MTSGVQNKEFHVPYLHGIHDLTTFAPQPNPMKLRKLSIFLAILCLINYSCSKKEMLQDELANARAMTVGTWSFYQHEIESFSGNTSTGKKIETFNNVIVQWKDNGTYILNRDGSIDTGTWELSSAKVFIYDKNDVNKERYYNTESLSNNFYTRKGPYKKDGSRYTTYLTTEYYKR